MEYIQENERTLKKDEGGINLRDVVELKNFPTIY